MCKIKIFNNHFFVMKHIVYYYVFINDYINTSVFFIEQIITSIGIFFIIYYDFYHLHA